MSTAQPPTEIAKWLEVLRQLAPKISAQFGDEFDFSERSLRSLDEFITKCWPEPPKKLGQMVSIFGAYVGETIRLTLGGQWSKDEEGQFSITGVGGKEVTAFPFSKLTKRFVEGRQESLAVYFQSLTAAVANANERKF
jgi:hypothetical protein